MHQAIQERYTHNHLDVCATTPFIDKPYFDWLCNHPDPSGRHMDSMAEYLCPDNSPQYTMYSGILHGTMMNQEYSHYRYTHQYYWRARLKWSDTTLNANLHEWQAKAIKKQRA